MEQKPPEADIGEVVGEHPAFTPEEFARSAGEYFEQGVEGMESITPDSHEVVIRIGNKVIPASEIKIKLEAGGKFLIKHKELSIGIPAAVFVVLAARHSLRTRKK